MIDLRNLSIRCGRCDSYQTLSAFSRRDDWHVYTYECESDVCEPDQTRTFLEIPAELDEFARREPEKAGGSQRTDSESTN